MKHIGILSHSFEGATLCYRTMCLEGVARLGPHLHPEITLTGVAMHHMLDAWDRDDRPTLRGMFAYDIGKLAAAGADFFVCPDNTAHIALESEGEPFALPGLHIGEVVAGQAQRDGRRKVAILGTNWTMTGPVYPGALGRRGIDWEIPDEADRQLIHHVIMDELCLGVVQRSIARRLLQDHCQARRSWLRQRRAGVHRNPVAGDRGCLAAADPGFDAAACARSG